MAQVGRQQFAASLARADAVRVEVLRNRHELAAARHRRAQLLHRPLVSVAPLHHVAVRHRFWSIPGVPADVLAAARQAGERSIALREESRALRGAVAWQLRRLQRTRRISALRWTEGCDKLDDIEV